MKITTPRRIHMTGIFREQINANIVVKMNDPCLRGALMELRDDLCESQNVSTKFQFTCSFPLDTSSFFR